MMNGCVCDPKYMGRTKPDKNSGSSASGPAAFNSIKVVNSNKPGKTMAWKEDRPNEMEGVYDTSL